jgi:hypothetical protein
MQAHSAKEKKGRLVKRSRTRHHYLLMILVFLRTAFVWGQQESGETPCFSQQVRSVPSRPTIASSTDPTQCGVVELEYGLERQWPGAGAQHSDFSGGLRFGLTPNLDFHWFAGTFLSFTDPSGNHTGYGDNWLGLKYRFLTQGKRRPSLGVMYMAKVPTGDSRLGLSSGEVDHAFSFLVSKDIHPFHFDFNVIPQLIGRSEPSGFDHNVGLAWATWLPVTKRLTLVAEPYGYTALNTQTPGFASVMAGGSFQVRPRLYLDTGMDVGVTAGAPHKRIYGGFTFAVTNVYTWLQPQRK